MSPLQIKILLHYRGFCDDYHGNNSPAEISQINYFLRERYLVINDKSDDLEDSPKYRATEKLHVYCEALCKVPEPEQRWVVGGVLVAGQGE